MYMIWFYKEDGTIDDTRHPCWMEFETKKEYDEACKKLESYGYVKGKDFNRKDKKI